MSNDNFPLQLVEGGYMLLRGLHDLGYNITNQLNESPATYVVNPLGYISMDVDLIAYCREVNTRTEFSSPMALINHMQSKDNKVLVKGAYYDPVDALITSERAVARCTSYFFDNGLTNQYRYRFRLYGCSFAAHGEVPTYQARKMDPADRNQIKKGLALSLCPDIPFEEVMYMKRLDVLYTNDGPIYDLGTKIKK